MFFFFQLGWTFSRTVWASPWVTYSATLQRVSDTHLTTPFVTTKFGKGSNSIAETLRQLEDRCWILSPEPETKEQIILDFFGGSGGLWLTHGREDGLWSLWDQFGLWDLDREILITSERNNSKLIIAQTISIREKFCLSFLPWNTGKKYKIFNLISKTALTFLKNNLINCIGTWS